MRMCYIGQRQRFLRLKIPPLPQQLGLTLRRLEKRVPLLEKRPDIGVVGEQSGGTKLMGKSKCDQMRPNHCDVAERS